MKEIAQIINLKIKTPNIFSHSPLMFNRHFRVINKV